MKVFDVIIIGAGPAGVSCAVRCRELRVESRVVVQGVFCKTNSDYNKCKKMFGVAGFFQGSPDELVEFYRKDLERAQIDVREGMRVVSVKRKSRYFEVGTENDVFGSVAVLVAVGIEGVARKLGVPGEDGKNVHYAPDDLKNYGRRSVLVVGGGDTAIEAAVSLSSLGAKVVLSYRGSEFFRVKELNLEQLNQSSVDVRFSSNVVEIRGKKVILRGADGSLEEVAADDVFVLAGTVRSTKFLKDIGLEVGDDGNIDYDEGTLETTLPGIFVAGDVTREKQKLIMPAMYQGFIAASSILSYKAKNQ
ncbi:MAG: NAD(P)/FAD-dependent oxidoreductase [archaeon]|nr:NAD(P)/FAD-dependent oxidoreductase [archaeon]